MEIIIFADRMPLMCWRSGNRLPDFSATSAMSLISTRRRTVQSRLVKIGITPRPHRRPITMRRNASCLHPGNTAIPARVTRNFNNPFW